MGGKGGGIGPHNSIQPRAPKYFNPALHLGLHQNNTEITTGSSYTSRWPLQRTDYRLLQNELGPTNNSIIEELEPACRWLAEVKRRKLQNFGHVVPADNLCT